VTEDEVIAEFLKSDFHSPAFGKYRESLGGVLVNPDLNDADENAKRRALLFLQHFSLWKQIPVGTEWHELEINEENLDQIRAFPRAQWRRLARGNCSITEVAQVIRTREHPVSESFLSKIDSIGDQLLLDDPGFSAVILIGINEQERLTVLDGNHRLVAAILSSPSRLKKLRFLCGLSPRMKECCWYNTNLMTLFRYGRNKVAGAIRNPEAELASLLRHLGKTRGNSGYGKRSNRPSSTEIDNVRSMKWTEARCSRRDVDMTYKACTLEVRQFPKIRTVNQAQFFLMDLQSRMNTGRPNIVFDLSNVEILERPAIQLLLRCLEEAIKRNGDIKLAAVPAGARSILKLTGVDRLFEIFDTNAEAENSFRRLPVESVSHEYLPDSSQGASENAA
jgi:anti-anti-sigma regulatory factor